MFGVKSLLIGIGAAALTATPILTLSHSSTIQNKTKELGNELSQITNLPTNYMAFYQQEQTNKQQLVQQNLKDGVNEWDYYFFYSHLYLNHSLTTTIQNDLGSVGGVVAALLAAIPEIAAVAGIIAAILIAQWYLWNILSYDKGNGVGINLLGVVPNIITSVWAQ